MAVNILKLSLEVCTLPQPCTILMTWIEACPTQSLQHFCGHEPVHADEFSYLLHVAVMHVGRVTDETMLQVRLCYR